MMFVVKEIGGILVTVNPAVDNDIQICSCEQFRTSGLLPPIVS